MPALAVGASAVHGMARHVILPSDRLFATRYAFIHSKFHAFKEATAII